MSGIPDRKTLEGLKRADLQKLCKDRGLKANLKSEALIDLLIETTKPLRRPGPSSIPKRASSLRVVSKSSAGSRTRDRSGGSVIIHDTDDEGGTKATTSRIEQRARIEPTPPAPTTRNTRKARETQYRLGVGRPAIAGGSGARAVTKSLAAPKSKRGRPSISVKPSEAAIPEEEENVTPTVSDTPQAGPSGVTHEDETHIPSPAPVPAHTPLPSQLAAGFDDLKIMFAELVNPLREQVYALQTELKSVSNSLANVASLELKVTELTNEVVELRSRASEADKFGADVKMLQEPATVVNGSGATPVSGNVTPESSFQTAAGATGPQDYPGVAASTLGKRNRDLDDGEPPNAAEEPKTGVERPKQGLRPSKKRAKLDEHPIAGPSTGYEDEGESDDLVEPIRFPPGPAFTIFSGPEEPPEPFDPPPPTTHLSDLFPIATPRAPSTSGVATRTAHAHENQIPTIGGPNSAFNFVFPTSDFHPVTSTPAGGPLEMGLPPFPYPEPPTSPTPGSVPSGGYIDRGGRRERNDLFHPIGVPSRPPSRPSRPRSAASRPRSASQSRPSGLTVPQTSSSSEPPCISPAALMRNPGLPSLPESQAERTPVLPRRNPAAILGMGIGVGMVGLPIQMPPDTPAPPLKRTMYGTELDADTRFGDFGVEGVAMGFWSGATHRI